MPSQSPMNGSTKNNANTKPAAAGTIHQSQFRQKDNDESSVSVNVFSDWRGIFLEFTGVFVVGCGWFN